jgi:hypothetical protein
VVFAGGLVRVHDLAEVRGAAREHGTAVTAIGRPEDGAARTIAHHRVAAP